MSSTYLATGVDQTFTVPAGLTSLFVDAYGAQGAGPVGGNGGRVQFTITPVIPGEVLTIRVGTQAGFGGGGSPGIGSIAFPGGGYSAVLRSGAPLVVAGGGGGTADFATAGGAGGGVAAVDGTNGTGTTGGGGGLSSGGGSGGAAGTGDTSGTAGASLQGGTGAAGTFGSGGGGGGGYFGGGGGGGSTSIAKTGSGGGGGSSFPVGATHTQGFQTGDGKIIVTS